MNPMFPGLKELLLPRRPTRGSADIAAIGTARALFQAPDSAVIKQHESLVEFLGHVSLFEGLARRDLARVARIVHEREYSDGDCICEEGRPGAALFVVRRGVVEVVKRGAGGPDVPLALLEPPASFEESAALGTGVPPGTALDSTKQQMLNSLTRRRRRGRLATRAGETSAPYPFGRLPDSLDRLGMSSSVARYSVGGRMPSAEWGAWRL
jgi:Cyclic nucleotide-binding domain